MKGNKKFLVVAVLFLLIAVSYSTYAIYKSSASASDTINAANWVIEVNGSDITTSANNTFPLGTIDWSNTRYGQNGTIAPGDTGTVTVTIDADGSEVGVHYVISADTTSLNNANFTVTPATGSSLTGDIAYGPDEDDMEAEITLNITWTGVDSESANAADINLAGDQITLPVSVTVTQNPNPVA